MATKYQLTLKGYVGDVDFDSNYVDYVLDRNEGAEVNVLINSLGGSLRTALSIASAFSRHGNVHVHFSGMNASAATIASLGAKRITMDSCAMYLVHKCSVGFFEYGQLNADQLDDLKKNVSQTIDDLNKMDAVVAQMYANKCKKDKSALLNLMKIGGWLTAAEALDWGFVDALTDVPADKAPVLDSALVHALANAGIPVPNLPVARDSAFDKLIKSLASLFAPQKQINKMDLHYNNICKLLSCEHLAATDGIISLPTAQLDVLEQKFTDLLQEIENFKSQQTALKTQLADKDKLIESLQNAPAANSSQVQNTAPAADTEPDNPALAEFSAVFRRAQKLYKQ